MIDIALGCRCLCGRPFLLRPPWRRQSHRSENGGQNPRHCQGVAFPSESAASNLPANAAASSPVLTCPWMTLNEARLIGWLIRTGANAN